MGWENENVFPLVIITAGGGFTGLFVYSPGPGAGNLVASIAAQSGTDPYGNSYRAGITSYQAGGANAFSELFGGQILSGLPGDFQASLLAGGGGSWQMTSGLQTAGDRQAILNQFSRLASGAAIDGHQLLGDQHVLGPTIGSVFPGRTTAQAEVQGTLALGGTAAGTLATFGADATGYPTVTDGTGGLSGNISVAQAATSNVNTVTGTTFANLAVFSIPANDAEAGAVYEVELGGFGTVGTTAQNLTLQARFGASPGAATDVVGVAAALNTAASGFSNSDTFQWSARVRAQCVTSGVSATWRIFLTGWVTDTTTAFANTIAFAVGTGTAPGSDVTQDSTALINIGLSAKWGSAVGSPSVSKSGSQFGRRA